MNIRRRLGSAAGSRRLIGALGALYVAVGVGQVALRLQQGASIGDVLVVFSLVALPGSGLVYGGYWLARSDIDPEFYADVARWCLAGFGVMAAFLLLYHVRPGEGITSPFTSPPILTALSSAAGLAVGVYDGQAKTRTRQLERRNRKLQRTQTELEETVAELEATNDRLAQQRAYIEDVLNAIDDVFYVIDENGSFRRWNDSLCDVTGYTDDEVASMSAIDFFAANEHDLITNAIADGFATGTVQIQAELLTEDGKRIPYEFVGATLEEPTEETVLAGVGRDISDRMQHERELERRARQQQAVAELGRFALETEDLDGLMHEASQRVADVLDTEYCTVLELDADSEELLLRQGVGWNEGIVGEAIVSSVEADSQAAYTLTSDEPVVVEDLETETRFTGPDLLRSHDVRAGISTVIGPSDDPWGILGTHDTDRGTYTDEDVAFVQSVATILAEAIERQQYQRDLEGSVAKLEESNARLEQFAHAASHDLQEPLRMVSSYLQLIDSRYGDDLDGEAREFLAFAVDGADRMMEMVEGLLEYSRVEMQGEPLDRTDLDEVVDDVLEDLTLRIEETDADVTVESLPTVQGDASQLRQVFQNLLSNALKYSGDEPPTVEISAERRGDEWRITVTDEGIGIDPDYTEQVFDVFQRLHTHEEHSGTGIGLALCERIVDRHGGDIWMESEPNEGTAVSFTLPAAGEVVRPSRDPDEHPA